MATKKPTTKKSSTSRAAAVKTTSKKQSVKKKETHATVVKPVPAAALSKTNESGKLFPENLANVILAEIIGTFILTLVALTSASLGALYVGLALVMLVFVIGAVSGAHVNPAVTFGLWVARKVQGAMVPVYMLAQFVGALFAIGVFSVVTQGSYGVNLIGSFLSFSPALFAVEMVGAAIFLFGVTTILSRNEINVTGKALGIGLSLFVALVAGGSLLSASQTAAYQNYQQSAGESSESQPSLPRELLIKGAVLNPAIAMAVSESTEAELMGTATGDEGAAPSRFGLEVILGTFAGAALGGGLYLLMAYTTRKEEV